MVERRGMAHGSNTADRGSGRGMSGGSAEGGVPRAGRVVEGPLRGVPGVVRMDAADVERLGFGEGASFRLDNRHQGPRGWFVSVRRRGERGSHVLRRLIMGVTERGLQVGHLNGDALDCRRCNLVVRTIAERNRAQDKTAIVDGKGTTSKYKGVTFCKRTRRWRGGVRVDGKTIHYGRCQTQEEAARRYDALAREHYGRHARLNFPGEGELGVEPNEAAGLPEGVEVAPLPEEREAMRAAEEASRRAAGELPTEEVWALFEVKPEVWRQWQAEGKVGPGERGRTDGFRGKVWYRGEDLERWYEALGPIGEPYEDERQPGVWKVPLTTWATRRGADRKEAVVDAASLELVRGKRWGWAASADGDGPRKGRVVWSRGGVYVTLARVVMGLDTCVEGGVEGEVPGEVPGEVDGSEREEESAGGAGARRRRRVVIHVNRDPLDCRRANLKVKSPSQAQQRCRKSDTAFGRKPTSRYKGVSWCTRTQRWVAQLKKDRKCRLAKHFRHETDAAKAYDDKAFELFGPEAYLNFPERYAGRGVEAATRRAA